jgi:hypothetical protein
MKVSVPFDDFNAGPGEVEVAGFDCLSCNHPVRLRFNYLGDDDDDPNDPHPSESTQTCRCCGNTNTCIFTA